MTDILYVIGSLEVGGTERHLSLVLPQLAARGWRVEVAVLERGGPFERPLQDAGIAVTRLEVPSPPPVPKLAGLLRLRAQAHVREALATAAPLPARLSTICRYVAQEMNGGLCHECGVRAFTADIALRLGGLATVFCGRC